MRSLGLAIAATGLILSSAAAAHSADETYRVSIPTADLNLYTAAGKAALKGRVKAQAGRICGSVGVYPLPRAESIKRCRHQFVSAADRRLQLATGPAGGSVRAVR